jgi:hypothetical protein
MFQLQEPVHCLVLVQHGDERSPTVIGPGVPSIRTIEIIGSVFVSYSADIEYSSQIPTTAFDRIKGRCRLKILHLHSLNDRIVGGQAALLESEISLP